MLRFAIVEHHHNRVHWDFMLEAGPALKTWALDNAPDATHSITAKPIADHRLVYLDYEGEISGGRGHVRRWDSGTFQWLHQSDNEVKINLNGQRLKGLVKLRLISPELWSFLRETAS